MTYLPSLRCLRGWGRLAKVFKKVLQVAPKELNNHTSSPHPFDLGGLRLEKIEILRPRGISRGWWVAIFMGWKKTLTVFISKKPLVFFLRGSESVSWAKFAYQNVKFMRHSEKSSNSLIHRINPLIKAEKFNRTRGWYLIENPQKKGLIYGKDTEHTGRQKRMRFLPRFSIIAPSSIFFAPSLIPKNSPSNMLRSGKWWSNTCWMVWFFSQSNPNCFFVAMPRHRLMSLHWQHCATILCFYCWHAARKRGFLLFFLRLSRAWKESMSMIFSASWFHESMLE